LLWGILTNCAEATPGAFRSPTRAMVKGFFCHFKGNSFDKHFFAFFYRPMTDNELQRFNYKIRMFFSLTSGVKRIGKLLSKYLFI